MEIVYLDEIDSTHKYLLEKLKKNELKEPIAVIANRQNNGIGSRDNLWIGGEGNLFLSFCLNQNSLPSDLPIASMSIYFSYILMELLQQHGSKVWLKWPNDFYINDKKVGGTLTLYKKDKVICSIGLNLKKAPNNFTILDIEIDKIKLIKEYFTVLSKKKDSWKNIFSKYKIQFYKSKNFSFTDNVQGCKVSLQDAKLFDDGSIEIDNRRIYSLR